MRNDTRTIYKYRLQDGGATTIKGWFTGVAHVGEQDGELTIWMENSLTKSDYFAGTQIPREENEKIELTVYAIGTGWPYFPYDIGNFIGTVQMSNGLVWHIFIANKGWVKT